MVKQCVILAGGLGTRISEETHLKPKPMIEVGGMPIIWHIMKIYAAHGIEDFIVCCGYKGYVLKEYFCNYLYHNSDLTVDLVNNQINIHQKNAESWRVTLVDTGENTQTAGRLRRVKKHLGDAPFCFTYGDGLSNVDIRSLIKSHLASKKLLTITAVKPPGRYGAIDFIKNSQTISQFSEKPRGDGSYINGGFFVVDPEVIESISKDEDVWEVDVLPKLALEGKINGFKHEGFWHAMDTLRDKNYLEGLYKNGNAPWKIW